MALEQELATYKRELSGLLNRSGKFVVIKGDKVLSTWETYADALQEGYRLFLLEPFLVKRIQTVEPVHHFTRDIKPSCRS
jgi:hypothetical protein